MFEALATIPQEELERRHEAVRSHLKTVAPEAGGLMVFSRLTIYYLTGTLGQGVLWLPLDGEPVLMLRKGVERARLEAGFVPHPFKSYGQIPEICAEAGSPLPKIVGTETSGLTWQLGNLLTVKMPDATFVPADHAIALAKAVKSEWELRIMRLSGQRHHETLHTIIPQRIRPGMTERELSHIAWEVFFEAGHQGNMRMQAHGEECFLGHVAAGDSGNYPSIFNGPLGLRGEHPASPYMGYAGKVWQEGEPLGMDIGFVLDGYHTDKTQTYWAGPPSTIPDEVRRAQDFCMDMQNWVAANARPGTTPEELYLHCAGEAEKRGFAEGFMGLGENKVPFIGHGIGLTIDEWPPLAKKFTQPLQAGMVIAVEPKQGIPGVGMVGVENTFEITEDGARCLTGDDYDIVCVE